MTSITSSLQHFNDNTGSLRAPSTAGSICCLPKKNARIFKFFCFAKLHQKSIVHVDGYLLCLILNTAYASSSSSSSISTRLPALRKADITSCDVTACKLSHSLRSPMKS